MALAALFCEGCPDPGSAQESSEFDSAVVCVDDDAVDDVPEEDIIDDISGVEYDHMVSLLTDGV